MGLRKAGKLILFPAQKRTEFSWSDYDEFWFASEIAWSEMKGHGTLDDILCDPDLAHQFDKIAQGLAPGFTPLHYRWGALKLRKTSAAARARSRLFTSLSLNEFEPCEKLRSWNEKGLSDAPGLYLIRSSPQKSRTWAAR